MTLSIVVEYCYDECRKLVLYVECRYADCHYAECRGTKKTQSSRETETPLVLWTALISYTYLSLVLYQG